jgi:hypothetical protein
MCNRTSDRYTKVWSFLIHPGDPPRPRLYRIAFWYMLLQGIVGYGTRTSLTWDFYERRALESIIEPFYVFLVKLKVVWLELARRLNTTDLNAHLLTKSSEPARLTHARRSERTISLLCNWVLETDDARKVGKDQVYRLQMLAWDHYLNRDGEIKIYFLWKLLKDISNFHIKGHWGGSSG